MLHAALLLHSLLSSTFTLFTGLSAIFVFHKFVLKQRVVTADEKEEVMRQARFIVGCKYISVSTGQYKRSS